MFIDCLKKSKNDRWWDNGPKTENNNTVIFLALMPFLAPIPFFLLFTLFFSQKNEKINVAAGGERKKMAV